MKVMQFYFTPSYKCDNDCIMCGVQKRKRLTAAHFSFDECKSLIDKMCLTSNDILEFSGGEPTIYKDFVELIKYAKGQYNPVIIVLSNGKRLGNRSFFSSVHDIGIDRFIIPVFSTMPHLHDSTTQLIGSFDQTRQGLLNLEHSDIPYSIKFIAMKHNYKDMLNVYKMKLEIYPSANYIISGFQLMGEAVANKEIVAVRHSMVAPYIEETIDLALDKDDFVPIFMFPMCLLDPWYWQYYGVGVFQEEVVAPDQTDVQLNSKLNYEEKPEKCNKCILSKRCTWAWKNYLAEFGDDEINPINYFAENK